MLTLILFAVAGFLGYDMASYYLYSPWTRDARVRADVVTVAPDVSGYIDDVRVKNDQFVHKGDVLFVIDQERYRIALADAEAAIGHASISFEQCYENIRGVGGWCRSNIFKSNAGSQPRTKSCPPPVTM